MSKKEAKLKIDTLIFSINDVLVDASLSYREVARQTVQIYLEQAVGLPVSEQPLLTLEEVTLMQKVGDFTDYWDLTAALIMYFIEQLPPVPVPTFPSRVHVPSIIAYLQMARGGLQINSNTLREQKDIAHLAEQVAANGGGLDGAHHVLPKQNRHLLVDVGNITKTNLVGRIFQELYLGADLFQQIYGQPAVTVQNRPGFINNESLLIDRDILAQISQKINLAIVSSRPRLEVNYALKARQIDTYFQAIVSLDDVREANGKPIPDPWPLLEAASRIHPTPTRSAYIGSNPGDVQAAKAANQMVPFTAIACLAGAHNKEAMRQEFEKLKAQIILGHPNHLKDLILD
jgi:HAD superfamily phosphatase